MSHLGLEQLRGVALFYKDSPRFLLETHQQHIPNFIRLKLVTGGQLWHVVGLYLALCNAYTLETTVADIGHWPRGTELLVVGDFNTDMEFLDGNKCDEAIVAVMETEGLKGTMEHLLPRKIPWTGDGRTWTMIHCGQEVRSRTDYILGKDRRMFQNVDAW